MTAPGNHPGVCELDFIRYAEGYSAPQIAQAAPVAPSPVAKLSPAVVRQETPLQELEVGFQKFAWWVGTAFQVIFSLIALIVVFVLYLKFSRKSEESTAWAQLPVDGPMQVNIEEIFLEAGTFNSKQVPCSLKIDVKISQKDWRVIADAGLMKYVLFDADGPTGNQYDPDNIRPWLVQDLKTVTHASFWDAQRMEAAKEQLLQNLVNLRARIEGLKEGPRKTSFEI